MKLSCDVCGKFCKTLGCYDDSGKWWICLRCFSKADAMAEREDRWPDETDVARLKTGDTGPVQEK